MARTSWNTCEESRNEIAFVFTEHGKDHGQILAGRMGALVGCVGVFASPFLRNGTGEPQSLLCVYACGFFAAGLFLLMHWFGVCGATGFQL